jgi:putative glutamine amidotransferase
MAPPIIGITTDIVDPGQGKPLKADCSLAYARDVAASGCVPVLLPPILELVPEHVRICQGFIFTGGDDPRMEPFGAATHPAAKPVHPDRQAYETRLLDLLAQDRPRTPVLGVCLGMQMMALHAGGGLNQHLPDTLATASVHRGLHEIRCESRDEPRFRLVDGPVWSNHHQAVDRPGRLTVLARSPDGVIEAVADPGRPFYVGVQWHPERTPEPALGIAIFNYLAAAVGSSRGRTGA